MITIKSILLEMKESVEKGEIRDPSWWLQRAVSLSALWQNLIDEKTKAEISFLRVVNEYAIDDVSDVKATKLAKTKPPADGKTMNEWEFYKYLEARDKIIGEMIKLAKKYSSIETNYNN